PRVTANGRGKRTKFSQTEKRGGGQSRAGEERQAGDRPIGARLSAPPAAGRPIGGEEAPPAFCASSPARGDPKAAGWRCALRRGRRSARSRREEASPPGSSRRCVPRSTPASLPEPGADGDHRRGAAPGALLTLGPGTVVGLGPASPPRPAAPPSRSQRLA
ncbi:collagen alpha-1(I) chain-like, partial [Phasianus colchicus]|uniref:collagen alpha-1(I) chain-like n=1 Tax=Phasianus colchicus TaxID=9054 RepID=UPI00129D527F